MKTPIHFCSCTLLSLALLAGCAGTKSGGSAADTNDKPAADLTVRLEAGETRAGVITDEAALFGGISAEGKSGDFKIYNSKVQFIIQAAGDSNYYVGYGGSVVDADVVRADGSIGQDVIDDASTMIGLGRMFSADTVEVIADGSDGSAAIIRATGGVAPLRLLTGTLESSALIPERDVSVITEYTLQPDAHLLEVQSTISWKDIKTPIQLADFMFMSADVTQPYQQYSGLSTEVPDAYGWNAIIGQRHEIAVAVLQGEEIGTFSSNTVLEALGDLGPLLMGSNPNQQLEDGDVVIWNRYVGVGHDIASMTDEWHARRGDATETLGGTVTSGGSPVAGVRVHFLDADDQPLTMAHTQDDGTYSADLPTGTAVTVVAESRGPGVYYDLEPGSGWTGPYNADSIAEQTRASLTGGAVPVAFSPGHGFSSTEAASADTALSLTEPGKLTVDLGDGGSAMVRVSFTSADVAINPAIAQPRPSGQMAYLYIRDGSGSIPLEPGTYDVVVSRGTTHEAIQSQITVVSGEEASITGTLEASVDTSGFWSLDPHTHAGPSGDGSISMEGRLIVHAAHDVDVHFGTDHDNIADYRPLLAPLGLSDRLVSIVADEVSPTMRGHHNAYPLETIPGSTNGGAFMWWRDFRDWADTTGLYAGIRAMASDGDIIIQANHPTGNSGLFDSANYTLSTGQVDLPEYWDDTFDAFEILNDGNYGSVLPYYLDMLNRGLSPTPVGVSDSHSHRGGAGENRTWVPLDVESVETFSNDDIRTAIRSAGTIASRGPLLVVTADGAWAPGSTFTGTVSVNVEVRAPSWMVIDTLHVFENGVETSTIELDGSTTVTLAPETDSVYVLTVSGESDMSPVYPGLTPWALAQAIFVDVAGDGWDSPLPPLSVD